MNFSRFSFGVSFGLDNSDLVLTPTFNSIKFGPGLSKIILTLLMTLPFEPSRFASFFPEFRTQLTKSKCKFRNCLHRDEPGCVINKDLERYPFYRENLEDMVSSHLPYQAG